jgi:hypothetical protein
MIDSTWRKSSYSSAQGNCVEVSADGAGAVSLRDSKQVPGPELTISGQAWSQFVQAIKRGEFDH